MTPENFQYVLTHLSLPLGKLLADGTTYRLTDTDFHALDERSQKALSLFEKMLVLSDGHDHVVGGILFYGTVDLQAWTLPEYRGMGYMSAIHKNGVLHSELYKGQRVSLELDEIHSLRDLEMRLHLLDLIGLKAENADSIQELMARWPEAYGDG